MSKANISLLTSGCSLDHCDFQFDEEEIAMSHSFQVPDDLYTELATYAARLIDALKTAPHIEVIHIDLDLDAASWTLLKAHADKEWSLVDASSFVIMSKHGMTEALTTDHHFTQAGFVRLPARDSIK